MPSQTIVFGVGRSGTTALFDYLVRMYLHMGLNPTFRYEPLLWDIPHGERDRDFTSTSALSPSGIAAHVNEPLFTKGEAGPHMNLFFDELGVDGQDYLIKYIRVCGRIETIMRRWPEAKCIFIFRNPSSTVESVCNLFTFFGDEFHRSDEMRFCECAGIDPESFQNASFALRQLCYWRQMNAAALESALGNPDRILPISQEALSMNESQTLESVGRFLFGDAGAKAAKDLFPRKARELRSARPFLNLNIADFADFNSEMQWFLDTLLPVCASGVAIDCNTLRERVDKSWAEGQRTKNKVRQLVFDPTDPPRDLGPLKLRQMLKNDRARQLRSVFSRQMSKILLGER